MLLIFMKLITPRKMTTVEDELELSSSCRVLILVSSVLIKVEESRVNVDFSGFVAAKIVASQWRELIAKSKISC